MYFSDTTLARMFHESLAATADMDVLPGVLQGMGHPPSLRLRRDKWGIGKKKIIPFRDIDSRF
jgi:hypothetical protein